jgi:hypothetical protein
MSEGQQTVAEAVRDYFMESAARNYAAHEFASDSTAVALAIICHRDGSMEINTTDRNGVVRGVSL